MSHITGLFSRRGYNLEGILCGAIGEGSESVMYLLVDRNEKYQQVISQLEKLHDVIELKERNECDHNVFFNVDSLLAISDVTNRLS